MSKRTLSLVFLILIVTRGIAGTGIYVAKKLSQPQKEPVIPPSIEPEEIAPEITPTEPSEADISNWKVYRNEKYGFEIKYPENWRIACSIMEWL